MWQLTSPSSVHSACVRLQGTDVHNVCAWRKIKKYQEGDRRDAKVQRLSLKKRQRHYNKWIRTYTPTLQLERTFNPLHTPTLAVYTERST